jgi:uncharacterized protein GlcG (DUF336 family)
MYTKYALELRDAEAILAACKAEALRMPRAVSIVVVDEAGELLAMARLDGASVFTVHMAIEKARSAALGRRATKAFEETIQSGRTAFLTVPLLRGLLEGGVPVIHVGQTIGAVGVSGAKSAEDAHIASIGIAAMMSQG